MTARPSYYDTLFLQAARYDDCKAMLSRLEQGARLEAALPDTTRAIHAASQFGSLRAIVLLTQLGADIDSPNFEGCSALHLAVVSERPQSIRALLNAGANPHHPASDGATPLTYSLRKASNDCFFAFFCEDNPAPVDLDRRAQGATLCAHALHVSNLEAFRFMADRGANLSACDEDGESLLDHANQLADPWRARYLSEIEQRSCK
jgi:ankyrin repeat protein